MAPQTQKALVVEVVHTPWKLRTDWLVPKPGTGEVLVKVLAAALNPADCRTLSLLHTRPKLADTISGKSAKLWTRPGTIAGNDFAGVVEELGPGTTGSGLAGK